MSNHNEIFIDRELSWLDFNKRVLFMSKNKNTPIGEQIKFAAIFGSNLDEFFMVRVGSLYDQMIQKNKSEHLKKQLCDITEKVDEMHRQCDKYVGKLVKHLGEVGYKKVNFDKLSKDDEKFWKKYFMNEVLPLLTPTIVNEQQPFPFIPNKQICICTTINDHEHKWKSMTFGLIPIGDQLNRIICIRNKKVVRFALVEELVYHYADIVFKDMNKKTMFRITRNADIDVRDVSYDETVDYRDIMSELIKKRRKLATIRIQFYKDAPIEIQKYLCKNMMVPIEHCFVQTTPLDLSFFFKISKYLKTDSKKKGLFYKPVECNQAPNGYNLYEEALKHDVLMAYPYQSMKPFIKMLFEAADDPSVKSIKMTLYRVAHESQIVQALIRAAENGKDVSVHVELRARFDEENNIDVSKQMEEAGCKISYGLDEYKVHAKVTLITREDEGVTSYVTQISTGNYNETTSELYTDLAYITTNYEIGKEAEAVFNNLENGRLTDTCQNLVVGPLCFKSEMIKEIEKETEKGSKGRIIIKNNAINDKDIINALAKASKAGVNVDMIVRGICCIRSGISGKTQNIHIRSIIGRYLEHSRIYLFGDGDDMRVYIASADFLIRNTEQRVEVGIRIPDKDIANKCKDILHCYLEDNVNAMGMKKDSCYYRIKHHNNEKMVNSQMMLYDMFTYESINDN